MYEPHLDFGKYAGVPLRRVPVSYLKWALANCVQLSIWLRQQIHQTIAEAEANWARAMGEAESRSNAPVRWEDVIPRWYRELAWRYHPDRAGASSTEIMAALNHARQRLEEMVVDCHDR
jgi:hypothetical protein